MTEFSFKQQKHLLDIATVTANKLADWSFVEDIQVDNESMKYFELMVREILIGVLYYKYGRKVEITSRSEEINIVKAINEYVERLKCTASQTSWESDAPVGTEQIDNLVKEKAGDTDEG